MENFNKHGKKEEESSDELNKKKKKFVRKLTKTGRENRRIKKDYLRSQREAASTIARLNSKYLLDYYFKNQKEQKQDNKEVEYTKEVEEIESNLGLEENLPEIELKVDEETSKVVDGMNISEDSKSKGKKFFSKISGIVRKKTGILVEAVNKATDKVKEFDQKMYNYENNFFEKMEENSKLLKKLREERNNKKQEEKQYKEEVKRRAKNINKIREEKINEQKRREKEEKNRQKEEEYKAKKKEREYFVGREYFPEEFKAKEDNFLSRIWNARKLKKERKDIRNLYVDRVKTLNDKYFAEILGEKNLEILSNIKNKKERKEKEKEMILQRFQDVEDIKKDLHDYNGIPSKEEIIKKYGMTPEMFEDLQRPLVREEILNKLTMRDKAEKEIEERTAKIKEASREEAMRRRYSIYIEKDLIYYKKRIEILKNRDLAGDKEEVKRLKDKIKSLDRIARVKVDLEGEKEISKDKERLEREAELSSKEGYEKNKKEFINRVQEKGLDNLEESLDYAYENSSKAIGRKDTKGGGFLDFLNSLFTFGVAERYKK